MMDYVVYIGLGISIFLCGVVFDMMFGNHRDVDTMIENAVLKYKYDILFDELREYEKKE